MCKEQFTESQNEWFVEKKLEAMPRHCDACRQLRYKQRKEKAAAETSQGLGMIMGLGTGKVLDPFFLT